MAETAPEWFAVSQAGLCLGAAWAIFGMYVRGTPVRSGDAPLPDPATRDPGLFWAAAAIGIWSVSGALRWPAFGLSDRHPVWPLLSSANSACLLLSAAHLDYGVGFLQRARDWARPLLPRIRHASSVHVTVTMASFRTGSEQITISPARITGLL